MGNRYECNICGQYITRDGWMSDEDWDVAIDEFVTNHYCDNAEIDEVFDCCEENW